MPQAKLRIAHIAAHVGGGVGSVLRDFVRFSCCLNTTHDVFCLDRCETNFKELKGVDAKYEGLAFGNDWGFSSQLNRYDVVLLHFWNHPLTAKFLAEAKISPCRLVAWSHNSGLHQPHVIPTYLANMALRLLFTSRCSFAAPNLGALIRQAPNRFGVVHSTRSLDAYVSVGRTRNARSIRRKLLYTGTVSGAKMHPESARLFATLSEQGFSLRVVGGPDQQTLQAEVARLGGAIEAVGWVPDALEHYRDSDLFVYPLRRDHYGTGEQVILEAMAAGLPVVAFNNPAECAIIDHGATGLLATSVEHFIRCVRDILSEPHLYAAMSMNGVAKVVQLFSASDMARSLIDHCREIVDCDKIKPFGPDGLASSSDPGLAIFAKNTFFDDSLAGRISGNKTDDVELIFNAIRPFLEDSDTFATWTTPTKSSPFHYRSFFPESTGLKALTDMIRDQIDAFSNRVAN